jgi:hypothetical protein
MILHPLTRHLAVCSLGEVQRFLDMDRNFWNLISIRDTTRSRLTFRWSKEVLPQYFDDAEKVEEAVWQWSVEEWSKSGKSGTNSAALCFLIAVAESAKLSDSAVRRLRSIFARRINFETT